MSPQQGPVPATKSRPMGIPRASNNTVQIQAQANERETSGPGNGLFIRHRTNAASVRLRRRCNGEEVTPTFTTPVQIPKRYHRLSGGNFEDNWEMENQRNLQRMRNYRPRAYSEDWDAISDDEFDNDEDEEERPDLMDPDRVRRNAPERKSVTGLCSNQNLLKVSPMETLDRRISVSTDQLDTLQRNKREKQSFRGQPRAKSASRQQLLDNIENEFESDRLRSKQSFESPGSGSGESDRKAPRKNSGHGSSGRGVSGAHGLKSKLLLGVVATKSSRSKSALEKFLDEGPYSRRLYGPPPPELSSSAQIDEERRKRTRSQEYLHNEVTPHVANQDDEDEGEGREQEDELEEHEHDHAHRTHSLHHQHQQQNHHHHHQQQQQQQQQQHHHQQQHMVHFKEEPANVQKKGLLWQQRDKLFSRWKERYFILTKDYFHCFKKGSSRMTEMGGFIFKLKLLDIDSVDLLDKRGYLTICISLLKEGKIYLRRPEGIKEWYTTLQTHIYDCKRKRKFWVESSRQITDSTGIEQWLLSRQKVGGTANTPSGSQFGYSASNPNIMDSSSSGFSSAHSGTTAPNSRHTSVERPNNIPKSSSGTRQPFTISRSQILDKNNNENKMEFVDDFDRRGLGEGHEPHMKNNASDFMTTRRDRIAKDEKLSKSSHEMAHNASDQATMSSAYSSGPRSMDHTQVKLTTSVNNNCNGLSQSPPLQIHNNPCKKSQGPIQPPLQPPRGINRMLLVNELILKEQLVGEDSCSKSGGGTADECSSSDMDMSTTTTTKSSSPRSTMQIVASLSPPNKSILRIKKVSDDSGHDSGHNSMHTNSSDSNSDGGSPEEHTACSPSMKNGGTTSVVTINGTSIKQPYTSLEDSLILSSDISSTPAELRASKSNFIRFRDKSCIATSSLRNPLFRKTYSLGQVITDL